MITFFFFSPLFRLSLMAFKFTHLLSGLGAGVTDQSTSR